MNGSKEIKTSVKNLRFSSATFLLILKEAHPLKAPLAMC